MIRKLTYLCAIAGPIYHATIYAGANSGFLAMYQDLLRHSVAYDIFQLLIYLVAFAGAYLIIAFACALAKTTASQLACAIGIYAMPLYSCFWFSSPNSPLEWKVVLLPVVLVPWALVVFFVALFLGKQANVQI